MNTYEFQLFIVVGRDYQNKRVIHEGVMEKVQDFEEVNDFFIDLAKRILDLYYRYPILCESEEIEVGWTFDKEEFYGITLDMYKEEVEALS